MPIVEEWSARIAQLALHERIALVQRILAGLTAPSPVAAREAAFQLTPAEQANLAKELLLALARQPQAQLDATLAIEARRRAQSD